MLLLSTGSPPDISLVVLQKHASLLAMVSNSANCVTGATMWEESELRPLLQRGRYLVKEFARQDTQNSFTKGLK